MVNNVYSNTNLGLIATYGKFNDPRQKQKQDAFTQALNGDTSKSKMESINTVVGSDRNSNTANGDKLNFDAVFKLSDTAQTLKEIAEQFNVKRMTLPEMKDLGNKLHDSGLISSYEFAAILKDSEDLVNSNNNAQDLLALWEHKLELLKENNSPRNLIDRAQQVIQVFKNIEAMHTEPVTDV